jgi:hypothetical protein
MGVLEQIRAALARQAVHGSIIPDLRRAIYDRTAVVRYNRPGSPS